MGKWDRFKGQLSLSRSTKVTGKENNYRNALSVSNIIVSRLQFFFIKVSRYLQTVSRYESRDKYRDASMHR